MTSDFQEIGHSGGLIGFRIATDEHGRRAYQISISTTQPVPFAWTAIYALPPGLPVGSIQVGGIGQPWNPPPLPGCIPVFVASNSEGKFGHTCPFCGGYWRSGPWPNFCPYCRGRAEGFQFLSVAQQLYVRRYCEFLISAINSQPDGEVVIDMDAVADAVGADGEKPTFYVSEESQQRKFTCGACGEFNDIIGRFGYCSLCGTRNDLAEFEEQMIARIRERLNGGIPPEDCVRDAVAVFDSFTAQVARQLADLVPLSKGLKSRLTTRRFHDLIDVREVFGT